MGKKGRVSSIEVACVFSGREEFDELLLRAFNLYVSRETTKDERVRCDGH